MSQPGIELVRDLIARFFSEHDPNLAPECFPPDFRRHGGSAGRLSVVHSASRDCATRTSAKRRQA